MTVSSRRKAKQSAKLYPRTPRKTPTSSVAHSPVKAQPAYRDKTGLEWLVHKRRITDRQAKAGKRYGEDHRIADTSGMAPLRSCLNDTPGGSDSSRSLPTVEYQLDACERLAAAQAALHHQPDMIGVLRAVCAQEKTPWEIVGPKGSARDVAALEAVTAVALDLLVTHYGAR